MRNFQLTDHELKELRAAHSAERNRNAAYKINAVILLGTGWKLKNVKAALLLDDETLSPMLKNIKLVALRLSYTLSIKAESASSMMNNRPSSVRHWKTVFFSPQQKRSLMSKTHSVFVTAQVV